MGVRSDAGPIVDAATIGAMNDLLNASVDDEVIVSVDVGETRWEVVSWSNGTLLTACVLRTPMSNVGLCYSTDEKVCEASGRTAAGVASGLRALLLSDENVPYLVTVALVGERNPISK